MMTVIFGANLICAPQEQWTQKPVNALQPGAARTVPTMLETLDRIHAAQLQRRRKPMTEDDMTAEIAKMRADDDQDESRWREIWSQTKPTFTDEP
jgi:hypothetical protein